MRRLLLLCAPLTLVAWLAAGQGAKPVDSAKEPPPFGFSGLEMYKVAWDTALVDFGDINGDGLTDIVFPENVRARIQCMIQLREPRKAPLQASPFSPNDLPEDTRFEKRPYLAGKRVFNLVLGDLNGDGRADLAYYGDPAELVVVYQTPKGTWGDKKTFDIPDGSQQPHTLILADFNADQRKDICLLGKDSTYFIYQTATGDLGQPVKQPGVPEDVFALVAGDFNGDGRTDLLYAAGNEDEPYSIRLQDARGRMSANVPLKVARIRAMITGDIDLDKADEILSIEQASGRLVVHKLGDTAKREGLLQAQPRVYPLPSSSTAKPRSMALVDLDEDGRLDVLMTNPQAAELEWCRQDESGALLIPQSFPTLQNASDVLAVDFDGNKRPEVVVVSPDEQTIGVARRLETGRIGFPERISTEGKPTAVGAGDLDGDGRPELIYTSAKGLSRSVVILKREAEKFRPMSEIPLQNVRSDPEGVVVADANQDGKPDILVFEPFGGMRILVQEAGRFVDVSQRSNYGMGLVSNVRAVSFALGDVTGDGRPEILIAQKNFARALKLDASGALQVVDQFNGRSPDSRIEGCAAADLDGDKVNEVLLLDAQAKVLSILKRQKEGTYSIVQNVPVGAVRLRGLSLVDFDRDGVMDVLIFASNKLVMLRSGAPHLDLREIAAYEAEKKEAVLADVSLGDLNNDGRPDVVLNNSSENTLEFLTYDPKAAKFALRLRFPVFEKKSFPGRGPRGAEGGGRIEPRCMEIADVTGDGKKDLVLIVHDRINLYPQD